MKRSTVLAALVTALGLLAAALAALLVLDPIGPTRSALVAAAAFAAAALVGAVRLLRGPVGRFRLLD